MSGSEIASGWLVKDGDGIRGELVDLLGAVTVITGVPAIRDGVRGYALTARLVSLPDGLKLPWEEETPP